MKVGDLVKRKGVQQPIAVGIPSDTTIYVITRVYQTGYIDAYTLLTISRASESLHVYEKDLILLEDTL